jgi:hypothetical protein
MELSVEYTLVLSSAEANKLVMLMKLCTNNDVFSKMLETPIKVFAATLGEALENRGA